MEGDWFRPLLWFPLRSTETNIVLGAQPVGAPIHVSRTKICGRWLIPPGGTLSPAAAKAIHRPSAFTEGELAVPEFGKVPSGATETNVVVAVQFVVTPRQVSRE